MRGDLQDGQVYGKRLCDYASRCQFPLSLMPIPFLPSTKSRFLCFFGLRNPRFQAFRAQNRHFCVRTGNFPLVFAPFEHKIGIFVRFWGLDPLFSGIFSTKSRFLCAFAVWNPCFRAFRAQNRHFCVRMGSFSQVFGRFEHIICIFVLGVAPAAMSQITLGRC